MTNEKEKKKRTFKECWKEEWEYRRWVFYIGVTGLSLVLLYDFIQLLLK